MLLRAAKGLRAPLRAATVASPSLRTGPVVPSRVCVPTITQLADVRGFWSAGPGAGGWVSAKLRAWGTTSAEDKEEQPPSEGRAAAPAAATISALATAKAVLAEGGAAAAAAAPSVSAPVAKFLAVFPPVCFGFLQLSPMKTILEIKKAGTVGDLPPLPFVSLANNCIVWSTYGTLIWDMTVLVPNFTGALCGIYYTLQYHKYAEKKPTAYYAVSGAILTAVAGMAATLPTAEAAHYIGLTGCTIAVVLMASPLMALKNIIRDKSTASMPFLTSFAVLLNSASWSGYGYFVAHNTLIWFPNLLGLAAASVQMALFAIYPSK